MPRAKKTPAKDKAPDLQWNEAMEAALFNAFVEQQNCGKRADMGWKSEAWGPVIAAVQGVYDGAVVITKSHCQTKEGSYKSHYRDHVWLERQSGFSFDKETGLFDAAPEAWEELLKVYQLC
jgi:Myb/SANT-like DNA-binding protein